MIELILNVSFMFSGCLGALDSNGIDDVVDHEYDTLPWVRYSHTWKIKKYWWPTVTISRFRAQFLINPHDQVNTSLGPKATEHSMMTPAQRQQAKVSRQLNPFGPNRFFLTTYFFRLCYTIVGSWIGILDIRPVLKSPGAERSESAVYTKQGNLFFFFLCYKKNHIFLGNFLKSV